ncbi:MAG: hypothetical protein ABIR32_14725 [Ilumatobacteraceae bacterium]
MTDTDTKWIVRQSDVLPAAFLSPDGTWGGAATARRFDTEEEALLVETPEGTTGFPRRLTYLPQRVF